MANEAYSAVGMMPYGMDGGRDASSLDQNTFAKGINISTRGGVVKTRPGIAKVADPIVTGVPQGSATWSLDTGDLIVGVTSGQIWIHNLSSGITATLDGVRRHPTRQCFFEQVDKYMVIQDGFDDGQDTFARPIILNFAAGVVKLYFYEDPADRYKMPVGSVMKYAHGRLHMRPRTVPNTSDNGGPYFLSGDIIYASDPQRALRFQETFYLNGGGAHALPAEMGYINGMGAFRNAATGTGYGSLVVFGRNGVCAFDMSLPRSTWATQQLSSVLFFGSGTVSPWSVINANDDLLYRSQDGLRSLRYTQGMTAGGSALALTNVSMSNEVKEYVSNEPFKYLPWVSMSFANNRLLMTAVGTGDRAFKGIISLDWANLYTMTQLARPAYDGIWTGLDVSKLLVATYQGRPTHFIVSNSSTIYRVDEDALYDFKPSIYVQPDDPDEPPVLTAQQRSIESRLITRAMAPSTSTSPDYFSQKKLKWLEMRISDLRRTTEFKVWFRPKGYALWARMGSTATVNVGDGSLPQTRRRLRFSLPDSMDECDPATKELLSNSCEFQFAIQWTGYCQIDTIRVMATIEGERPPEPCSETESVVVTESATAGEVLDDFSYVISES